MYVITFRGVLLKREICLAWLETMRRDNETCSEHARLWVTKQSTARQLGVCVCVCVCVCVRVFSRRPLVVLEKNQSTTTTNCIQLSIQN